MKAEGLDKAWDVQEKCRAVLAVWTERRRASGIRKEMGISASLLSQWQERAMEGMLEVLEPRGRREVAVGPALGNTVKKLLEKKSRQRETGSLSRLDRKLIKLQETKVQASA